MRMRVLKSLIVRLNHESESQHGSAADFLRARYTFCALDMKSARSAESNRLLSAWRASMELDKVCFPATSQGAMPPCPPEIQLRCREVP
jgi:hypothetical protein